MSGGDRDRVDVAVIGGGPAGLSAALNLARARRSVLLADTGRPRNAATLIAHGFITRDGIPPHELRALAVAELERYPEVEVLRRTGVAAVCAGLEVGAVSAGVEDAGGRGTTAAPDAEAPGFTVELAGGRVVRARRVVVATGLRETLPAIPSIRAFYGMSLFSCVACDGYEHGGKRLALIGETDDLVARALLIAQWSSEVTVFTGGIAPLSAADEAELAARGILVEREPIDDLEGDRGTVSAVRLASGRRVPIDGGFVRPRWQPALDPVSGLGLERDPDGLLVIDRDGRTSVPGVYAAGDVAAPGPAQLIVAAGAGARVATVVNQDLIGVLTSH